MIRLLFGILSGLLFVHPLLASGGEGIPAGTVISQISNLGILILFLYFTQRKKIGEMFRSKKEEFLKSVDAASASKKEANDKLTEVNARVNNLVSTFDSQIADAKKQAEENYRVQLTDAKNEALRLKSMAQTSLEFEIQKEVENLRIEAFNKSAHLAEQNLQKQLTPDQQKAWNNHFVSSKEGVH